MRRSLVLLLIASATALAAAACNAATSVGTDLSSIAAERGPVVALDSLRLVDAVALPCCAVDSADARVTIVGGTLTFRRYAEYTDTVFTPGGPMSGACVTGIPNGAHLHRNGLVTLPDSTSYLMIPCHLGIYTLAVSERFAMPDGSGRTAADTLSVGTYSWKRDTLALMSEAGRAVSAMLSADTIVATTSTHTYRFQAVAAYY